MIGEADGDICWMRERGTVDGRAIDALLDSVPTDQPIVHVTRTGDETAYRIDAGDMPEGLPFTLRVYGQAEPRIDNEGV